MYQIKIFKGPGRPAQWLTLVLSGLLTLGAATPGVAGGVGPGLLEIPQTGSAQSGVGIVSGWKCDAGTVTARFDGGNPIEAAYGTTRGDTVGDCGDDNNAFVLQWNYALLGDGAHEVRLYDDAVEFAAASFSVATFGVPFLRGAVGEYDLFDFPESGDSVNVAWQQAAQRFVIVGLTSAGGSAGHGLAGPKGPLSFGARAGASVQGATLGLLEVPQPLSTVSGIGIVSGWVCEAGVVEIIFDGGAPIEAAYGTTRNDTIGSCGDDNNAFVLQWNYSLLGDGPHTVAVLADGAAVAMASFNVQTLGVPFLRGASGTYELEDFPEAGSNVTVEWQQAAQGFGVTATQSGPTPTPGPTPTVGPTASPTPTPGPTAAPTATPVVTPSPAPTPSPSPSPAPPTYAGQVSPILNTKCAGCHTGGGSLGGFHFAGRTDIVNQPSSVAGLDYVEPGSTAQSYLWHKINGTQGSVGGGGAQMPTSGALSAAELATIQAWILGGAN